MCCWLCSITFIEIDNEIISTVILPLPMIQEGLLSVTRKSLCTKYCLVKLAQEKVTVVRLTDRLNMTIAVDWEVKPQTKTKWK